MNGRQPLAGRSFHMMGVAGAGVSALARLAVAWGADVTGCDRSDSAFMQGVREAGIPTVLDHDAAHVVAGSELVVSSAVPDDHPEVTCARRLGVPVHLRGQLLGEFTRLRNTVVVAGAHGKSTTTAMIVHALLANGIDATMIVGGDVPALGGNMRAGASKWMVVEGDESDRTLAALSAQIAVVTNLERDHHHTFASDEELLDLFRAWIAGLGDDITLVLGSGPLLDVLADAAQCRVVRFPCSDEELDAIADTLSVPGRHNALNAAAAVEICELLGIVRSDAIAALADFGGVGRRFEVHGTADGVTVVDDYGHHPTEVAATIAAARERCSGPVTIVFQPHLFTRTRELWREFAQALAAADRVVLLPVYAAREQPIAGVDERLIGDELERLAPGTLVAVPGREPCEVSVDALLDGIEPGGMVITMGAGDVTRLAPALVARLTARAGDLPVGTTADIVDQGAVRPALVERDVPLHRMTTIGTGGTADWFARVPDEDHLQELLAWAAEHELPVAVVGLGSNTLIGDAGFRGLALRLTDRLARIEIPEPIASDSTGAVEITCGGGATLAAVVRRCRDAGLSGFEFGCAIPGTVGGAVKMNAGCYGGEIVDILAWADVVEPGRRMYRVEPGQLDMTYRHTNLQSHQIVAQAGFRLVPGNPDEIRDRVREMQGRRSQTQPRAARSFGSVFQNPQAGPGNEKGLGAGALIEQVGLKGHVIGGACISPKHGNFIENLGTATTDDILALIDLARATVAAQTGVVLQTEVHLLDVTGFRPLNEVTGAGS